MMRGKMLAMVGVMSLLGVAAARADVLVQTDTASFGPVATNFPPPPVVVTLDKYNPIYGPLTRIEIDFNGSVSGMGGIENLNAASGINGASLTLSATLTLMRPDNSTLVAVIPSDVRSGINLGGFDSTIDFGGTSGVTFNDFAGSDFDGVVLNPVSPADLALFTATFLGETIDLNVSGVANSVAMGSGNVTSFFNTFASGDVTIRYYANSIPSPASAVLGLMGTGLVTLRRRRMA